MPDINIPIHQDWCRYVRVSEMPSEQQKPFCRFITGQTCPVIEGAKDAVYVHDYELFLEGWRPSVA